MSRKNKCQSEIAPETEADVAVETQTERVLKTPEEMPIETFAELRDIWQNIWGEMVPNSFVLEKAKLSEIAYYANEEETGIWRTYVPAPRAHITLYVALMHGGTIYVWCEAKLPRSRVHSKVIKPVGRDIRRVAADNIDYDVLREDARDIMDELNRLFA